MSTLIFFLAVSAMTIAAQPVFIETETFTDKGGWSVDQQFIDQMGSTYLIAHGLGKPVEDAKTIFETEVSGNYHFFVRTFNWTSPWTDAPGAGAFKIEVEGTTLKTVLGTAGDRWMWQYAGAMKLKAGRHNLSLVDLKGFDGRCDAIWITPDKNLVPPEETKELELFRREVGAISKSPEDGGKYDFIVVGAGIGGICAAVSAARLGLKVALVSDRAVIGGNNSSEIRVHLSSEIEMEPYPALGRMLREFGHTRKGNAGPPEIYEDQKKLDFIASEPNIKLFTSYRAVAVDMEDEHTIAAVTIRSVLTGEELSLKAPLFSDCTGDGNLGFMAGADWRMGRESRSEFGESLAPEIADSLTMGASVQWYSAEREKPTLFPEFNYGITFTEESCEKVVKGEWHWETGLNRDQISEFERIRDYGMFVIYSNWSFLKNHSADKAQYANRELDWVAYTAGKRESRRLMGDYILKQDDVDKQVFHEDASFTTAWHFDLHFPDKKNSQYFPNEEFKASTKNNLIYPYAVPYRCLYSRNIDNMFMAGRNISTTHVTLGSTRLMRTIAMMGEVVGMAASICHSHSTKPRDVYQHYLPELKELMTKGVGSKDAPDTQNFNHATYLKSPKWAPVKSN